AAKRGVHTFSSCRTFPDDPCSCHVAGLQRMHEGFALHVDQLSSQGTYFFRYQRAVDLGWKCHAGGMVLDGVLVKEGRSRPVSQDQAVCSCSVMVGGGEALIMHPSCASGGNDHGLGPCHQIIAGLQVLK